MEKIPLKFNYLKFLRIVKQCVLLNVISLGQAISDNNYRMITKTEETFWLVDCLSQIDHIVDW